MRELAQKVINQDLSVEETKKINEQLKDLEEQVRLLNGESILLS
ncbi:hypothetical protein [Petroclostridium sp. X23]|nr:hypothetical protein [Petroclostridium sp. X23]WHH61510.1 hypothetical protein QKW49_12765 [Petroclostridium sp. X23]